MHISEIYRSLFENLQILFFEHTPVGGYADIVIGLLSVGIVVFVLSLPFVICWNVFKRFSGR